MTNNKLDKLFERWISSSKAHGDQSFCPDGVICRGRKDIGDTWQSLDRRVVFLLKEQNANPDEDVREWVGKGSIDGKKPHMLFYNRLSAWLYGLLHINANSYPSAQQAHTNENQMDALFNHPYGYVNIKKESGGATADNALVEARAKRDAGYIREQLDILNPSIVVCCGEVVFKSIRNYIYNDTQLEKLTDWVYYAPALNIAFINSYHPSARHKSSEVIYNDMMQSLLESNILTTL